jgi:chemotaxis response regulator CheB
MIRILLVDDQNIVRQGIQALLEPRPKLKVVGTAEDGNSAIEQVGTLMPDLVLMGESRDTCKIVQDSPQILTLYGLKPEVLINY